MVVTGLGKYFQHGAHSALINSGGGMGGVGGGRGSTTASQLYYLSLLYMLRWEKHDCLIAYMLTCDSPRLVEPHPLTPRGGGGVGWGTADFNPGGKTG